MEIPIDSFEEALRKLIKYCDEQADLYNTTGGISTGAGILGLLGIHVPSFYTRS